MKVHAEKNSLPQSVSQVSAATRKETISCEAVQWSASSGRDEHPHYVVVDQ